MEQLQQISFEYVLENISDGICIMNKDLQITFFNKAAEQITEISRLEAVGKRCSKVFRSSLCEKNCVMQKTFATKIPICNKQALIINAYGQKVPINISTALLRNRYHEVIGCIEIFQDLRPVAMLRGKSSLQVPFEELITRNPIMGDIVKNLPKIAARKNNVLIEGETGTGRETLANAIHALSVHRSKPFIALDCAAQPNTTLAVRHTGDHRRFFSDVYKDCQDSMSLRRGSTLYLHEIGETGPAFQEELLELLRKKKIDQKSGDKPFRRDIRIIASTKRNLSSLVKAGRFHPDLCRHISNISIVLPPLRERKEDIPLLIDHFIASSNRLQSKYFAGVSQEALDRLMAYDFPANIRELKQVITEAYASCAEGYISPAHLPERIRNTKAHERQVVCMEEALQIAEAQIILIALKKNNYNRTAAARDLCIHKSTFFRKIKQLGLVLPQIDGRFRSLV